MLGIKPVWINFEFLINLTVNTWTCYTFDVYYFRWSYPEKGENFTDSGSSTPEFMFEYTDPSLRGEVYSEEIILNIYIFFFFLQMLL